MYLEYPNVTPGRRGQRNERKLRIGGHVCNIDAAATPYNSFGAPDLPTQKTNKTKDLLYAHPKEVLRGPA